MHAAGDHPSTNDILELLTGRPGWRLEPSSTPGSAPQWCFVFNGRIEFSVAAGPGGILLYVMDADQEIVFPDSEALRTWLRTNRTEAMQDPEVPSEKKSRFRRMTEWG